MHAIEPAHVDWRPSVFRIGPLFGLGALLFAAAQIVASFAVLRASDGDEVANWRYQPTVYLAVLSAICNKALAFAAVQGTVITWWIKAIRGTNLEAMHRDWGFGLFLYKAVVSGRHFNALALSCICATLVAMDGPLLQRASSVRLEVPQTSIELSVSITPEIPAYFTGWAILDQVPLYPVGISSPGLYVFLTP